MITKRRCGFLSRENTRPSAFIWLSIPRRDSFTSVLAALSATMGYVSTNLTTDRNLLFARPPVLSAARVGENWFLGLTEHGARLPAGGLKCPGVVLGACASFGPWPG